MKTLLPISTVKNAHAEEPWKKIETDKMLDLYFAGTHTVRIGATLQRNPKAIKRRIEDFTYNYRDKVTNYEPRRRVSRKGKRITENEKLIIAAHKEKRVPPPATARLLQRDVSEFFTDRVEKEQINEARRVSSDVDMVLAYRYLYYAALRSPISNATYDDLKKEALEFAVGNEAILEPASDRVVDYPEHIRMLGLYLLFKADDEGTSKNTRRPNQKPRG